MDNNTTDRSISTPQSFSRGYNIWNNIKMINRKIFASTPIPVITSSTINSTLYLSQIFLIIEKYSLGGTTAVSVVPIIGSNINADTVSAPSYLITLSSSRAHLILHSGYSNPYGHL